VRGDGIRLASSQMSVTFAYSQDSTYWLNCQHFCCSGRFCSWKPCSASSFICLYGYGL